LTASAITLLLAVSVSAQTQTTASHPAAKTKKEEKIISKGIKSLEIKKIGVGKKKIRLKKN